ncbi:MAG: hypothetical protein S0880_22710 [Actinomycetota bacterium]|nr:hypothetical protein [Actinomycetota bacterium]
MSTHQHTIDPIPTAPTPAAPAVPDELAVDASPTDAPALGRGMPAAGDPAPAGTAETTAAPPASPSRGGDRGQTTVEYALVVLGAATVALLVLAWASGSGRIGALLDAVFDQVIGQVA